MVETSFTYLFGCGYYDIGTNNDKAALFMRLGYISGSGAISAGWTQAGAALNYYYVKILKYSESGSTKFMVGILEKLASGGGIGVTRIVFNSFFLMSS